MGKIRINDLARELEVKSKAILDVLPQVGVTEKKSHSSSVEDHEAEKVRAFVRAAGEAQSSAKQARTTRTADDIKTKIDLSNISRPGDVLNAIRKQQPSVPADVPAPKIAPPPVKASPAAVAPSAKAAAPAAR
jgi:translation initiation factor IF-2